MILIGTEDQVKQMAANAVNAASPMGLGHLHATRKEFKPEDFQVDDGWLSLDYVQGRMTKLTVLCLGDNKWSVTDQEPRADYQSWCYQYPTYQALAESAGMSVEASPCK